MVMGAAIASSRSRRREASAQQQQNIASSAQGEPNQDSVGNDDVVEQLKKFAELRDQGILTEEEFAAQKKKLLS